MEVYHSNGKGNAGSKISTFMSISDGLAFPLKVGEDARHEVRNRWKRFYFGISTFDVFCRESTFPY